MTTSFKSPPAFVPGADPASAWAAYKEEFEIFAVAADLDDKTIAKQRATFLHILGREGLKIYNTLQIPKVDDDRTLPVIFAAFDDYYQPYKNLTYLRYAFFQTKQTATQTFDNFYTDLKTKAQDCEFGALMHSLIATQIVCGIRQDKLRKTLLAVPNLTMEEAVRRCQMDEVSASHATTMGSSNAVPIPPTTFTDNLVDALHRQRFQPRSHNSGSTRPPSSHRLSGAHGASLSTSYSGRRAAPPAYNRSQPPASHQRFSQPFSARRPPNPHTTCPNCGHAPHVSNSCPARFAVCLKCQRRGHWATVCRTVHDLQTAEVVSDAYLSTDSYFDAPAADDPYISNNSDVTPAYDQGDDYYCYSITLSCEVAQLLASPIDVDDIYDQLYLYGTIVTLKIDTGSQVNIIPFHLFESLQSGHSLRPPQHKVMAFSGHPVPIAGILDIPCQSYAAAAVFPFYVTKENRTPILGAAAAVQLGLIQHHRQPLGPPISLNLLTLDSTDSSSPLSAIAVPSKDIMAIQSAPISLTVPEIVQQYHTVFDTVGRLPGRHHIQLRPYAVPAISAAHTVPQAFREAVRLELDRMQQLGIIVPVTGPSDWVHPMVVTAKPDGTVRICLDPRKLNGAIKRQPFPVPTTQQIFAALSGKTVFTVLDVQSAFWHIQLTEESSRLCTFATPHGRFRYLRYPNGLVTGSEVCQQTLRKIFPENEFPNVTISTDDFLIATEGMAAHKAALLRVLQRALEVGLCFGRKKMRVAVDRVKYVGHIISPKGVEVDTDKVTAICSLPTPCDKAALQSFLGMINYITRFIPDSNANTAPLRALLKMDVIFQWEPDHQKHYEDLKTLASTAPVLGFFDPNLPITLSVDSSQSEIGAVLLQNGQPIEYASTSLNSTQCRYAQIEKELLAIVFACEHFHYYVAGTKITVETDHNPLLGVVKKPLHLLSPRLQRLVMRLFRYHMDLVYVPGSQLHIADMLSRAPQKHTIIDTRSLEGPYASV